RKRQSWKATIFSKSCPKRRFGSVTARLLRKGESAGQIGRLSWTSPFGRKYGRCTICATGGIRWYTVLLSAPRVTSGVRAHESSSHGRDQTGPACAPSFSTRARIRRARPRRRPGVRGSRVVGG